ncbi:unnamed protein product [Merluccius merluccius]
MQRPVDALLYLTLVTALVAVLSEPQNGKETSGGEATGGPLSNATGGPLSNATTGPLSNATGPLGLTSDTAAPATQEDPSTAFSTSEPDESSPTSPNLGTTDDDYIDWTTAPGPLPGATRTTAAAASSSPPGNSGSTLSAKECMFNWKQGLILLMVAGVLIVVCVGLLVTAAVLAWKVCQRRRDGGRDPDLISNSEYWMGSVQRNKAQRRYDDAPKENCLLLGALEIKEEGEQGGGGGSGGGSGGGGGDGGVSSGGEAADKKKKKEETGGEKEVTEAGKAVGSDPVPAPRGNGTADVGASAGPA